MAAHLDLDPSYVAAVVAFLASDDGGDITGRIIHTAGAEVCEYRPPYRHVMTWVAWIRAAHDVDG